MLGGGNERTDTRAYELFDHAASLVPIRKVKLLIVVNYKGEYSIVFSVINAQRYGLVGDSAWQIPQHNDAVVVRRELPERFHNSRAR